MLAKLKILKKVTALKSRKLLSGFGCLFTSLLITPSKYNCKYNFSLVAIPQNLVLRGNGTVHMKKVDLTGSQPLTQSSPGYQTLNSL